MMTRFGDFEDCSYPTKAAMILLVYTGVLDMLWGWSWLRRLFLWCRLKYESPSDRIRQ